MSGPRIKTRGRARLPESEWNFIPQLSSQPADLWRYCYNWEMLRSVPELVEFVQRQRRVLVSGGRTAGDILATGMLGNSVVDYMMVRDTFTPLCSGPHLHPRWPDPWLEAHSGLLQGQPSVDDHRLAGILESLSPAIEELPPPKSSSRHLELPSHFWLCREGAPPPAFLAVDFSQPSTDLRRRFGELLKQHARERPAAPSHGEGSRVYYRARLLGLTAYRLRHEDGMTFDEIADFLCSEKEYSCEVDHLRNQARDTKRRLAALREGVARLPLARH